MISEDTIVAISTPIGSSGIGIVRMSGDKAFVIARKIFSPSSRTKVSWTSSFKMYHGWILDPETKEPVDEVILSLMRAPRTYTREDVVEINCHGGLVPLRKILEICLREGARLAEPGEFTKRAFLNGRIDLSQAESVLEIVQAKTEKTLNLAIKSLRGELSNHILSIREEMIDILSILEAEIDFAEEEIEILPEKEKEKYLDNLIQKLENLLDRAKTSQVYREGIKAVIAGKTNVGKSSLLNTLLERERAIVSHIPGTTRDTIEETINIKGFPVCIIDTAGLGIAKNPLDEEGAKRTRNSLKMADIILRMGDGSSSLEKEDEKVFATVKELKKQTLLIINKIDLPQRINKNKLREIFPHLHPVEISATQGSGLGRLKTEIANLILKKITPTSEDLMINMRQKNCLEKTKKCLIRAKEGLENNLSVEFLALEMREGIEHLDELTGRSLGEEVLNRIFSRFCIGK
ncbi:tRNA uridine-5-carboxymethylaminomethyl(34) synthesis GTPase MnmE [Candidatus Aerophobetes bacterium]|uniref:tRNA modification GTPase MnmE n=1 Tax=Aerophobetes bacterium TaxID=2030807 RepID=A0A662DAU0_UNCAE|nr:MAG: tRNA uridine-5-carboxymethylaminomethyl(34) synthesis GTPase MnmE [Candidatus Aerophobetes bacterium]